MNITWAIKQLSTSVFLRYKHFLHLLLWRSQMKPNTFTAFRYLYCTWRFSAICSLNYILKVNIVLSLLHLTTYYGTDLCKYLEPDMKRYIYLNVFIAYMQYIMLDSRDPDILLSATIFDIFLQRTIGAACAKHIQAGGRFFDMTLLRIIEKLFSKFSGWKSQD